MQFPRQDIPESEKTLDWAKQHLLYARQLLKDRESTLDKKTRLYNQYNGRTIPSSIAYLTKTYGKKNRTKYISYRLGRPKIDLLNNEFLKRPLYSYVSTINIDAKTAKLENYETMLGAAHAKPVIEKMRENGVDPLNGASIPDLDDNAIWESMNTKERNEKLMQTLIDNGIREQKMKLKLAKNFQDIKLVSECFGKIDVDENGDEEYYRIDPRNAIYEEIEEDYFLEKSPIMGARTRMPIHNILMRYRLTQEQRNRLESIRTSGTSESPYYYMNNGSMCADVIHIEWKSVTSSYYILSPKTNAQMEFDDSDPFFRKELDAKDYDRDVKKYKRGTDNASKELTFEQQLKNHQMYGHQLGEKAFKEEGRRSFLYIETKFHEELYEATMIGDETIVVDFRKKPFTMRRIDKPAEVLSFSYCGALFNTVNNERISLQEIIENFDNMFDIVMFQILKEINKAKGKILGYDRAMLPKDKTIKDVMYDALNDSFVDYDSSSQGNWSGKNIDVTGMLKEHDLGLSSSFPSLIEMKREIQATIDRLTGINENREGQIQASATATNAQSSIAASRTMTDGMFYFMSLYTEKVLLKMCETMKLTWGLYKTEKAKIILGDSMFNFMQLTRELYEADYGVVLVDGGKELSIRDKMERMAESSLNAKEIRFRDYLAFELTETLTDGKKVLENAWNTMEKIRREDQSMQLQSQEKQTQLGIEGNIQAMREDREDKQAAKINEIVVQGDTDIRVNAAAEKHGMIRDQNTLDNKPELA